MLFNVPLHSTSLGQRQVVELAGAHVAQTGGQQRQHHAEVDVLDAAARAHREERIQVVVRQVVDDGARSAPAHIQQRSLVRQLVVHHAGCDSLSAPLPNLYSGFHNSCRAVFRALRLSNLDSMNHQQCSFAIL